VDQLLIKQLCDQNKTVEKFHGQKKIFITPFKPKTGKKIELNDVKPQDLFNKVDLSQNVFINFMENKRVSL
jgi:hypothetical protein